MRRTAIAPIGGTHRRRLHRLAMWTSVLIGLSIVAVAGSMTPSSAYTRPGSTEIVSLSQNGLSLNGNSRLSDMTPDGRFVVFSSQAGNVLADRELKGEHVFVYDRFTEKTDWITPPTTGPDPPLGNYSRGASISADGRFVVFYSSGANLVAEDTNQTNDIFLMDRATGTSSLLTRALDGGQANGGSIYPSISLDGRYVAFESDASNLVPGDTNKSRDVFVLELQTRAIERVSVASDEVEGQRGSGGVVFSGPAVSGDGRYVAFASLAPNLVPGDDNNTQDVFVRDRHLGTTEIVSVDATGDEGNGESYHASITPDGRYVGFASWASDLVPGDGGLYREVDYFVHDRTTKLTERLSVSSSGEEATEDTGNTFDSGSAVFTQPPAITPDGRFVAFLSSAPNLAPGDVNGRADVFVRDRQARTTERVSLAIDEAAITSTETFFPLNITPSGRYVAFSSADRALVPGDENGDRTDVFIRDRGPREGIGEIRLHQMENRLRVAGWARLPFARLTQAQDEIADSTSPLRDLGGELVSASILQRPEEDDLLVRLQLQSLPSVAAGANAYSSPGARGNAFGTSAVTPFLYGLDFTVDGTRYQLRGTFNGGSAEARTVPSFGLYRCGASCSEVARVRGGIGVTGADVSASLPLEMLDAYPGMVLDDVRAFVAAGEARAGALDVSDDLTLPDGTLVGVDGRVALAASSIDGDRVAFKTQAHLLEGEFVEILDTSGLAPGEHRAWVKVCFDADCWTSSKTFRVD